MNALLSPTGNERPTALVTGASAGIGAAFCHGLAARGYNIVAVARRADRLTALARELHDRHGVEVQTLCIDLGERGAVARVLAALGERPVDMLVNNAGYGVPGRYLSSEWMLHERFQRVMVETVAEFCHALLPAMRARGCGNIINVASLAGFMPGSAGHTLYAASKAWVLRFSESLALEYEGEGIRVCALCPGFTVSEFHDVTGTRAQLANLPSWLWMSAAEVVDEGLAAVARGEVVYIPGRINRLIAALARCMPPRLALAISRRASRRFRDIR